MHTFGKHKRKFIHALITVMLIFSNISNIKNMPRPDQSVEGHLVSMPVCFCAYFDRMVYYKNNRMKQYSIERHHMGKSLECNPINPKTVNKRIFLLPALAAAIVFFSFGAAGSGNLPKSDIAPDYAQADSSNNNSTNNQTNLDQLASN